MTEVMLWGGLLATVALSSWRLLGRGHPAGRGTDENEEEFWDWVDLELERARRHERPMSVLSFAASQRKDSLAPDPGWAEHLRATDHTTRGTSGIYFLAPDTDREGAEILVARLKAANPWLGLARIACFPEDALTRGSLVEHLDHSRSRARSGLTELRGES